LHFSQAINAFDQSVIHSAFASEIAAIMPYVQADFDTINYCQMQQNHADVEDEQELSK
jgi:hypothetical protein